MEKPTAYSAPTQSEKRSIIASLFLMTAVFQMGQVLYTPALAVIAHHFSLSITQAQDTITSYLLAIGVSQIIYGVLSDHWGRKSLMVFGMILFSVGCLWTVFSSNYWTLCLSRFLQGLGAGATITLGRAILSDAFSGKDYARTASYLSSGFAFGLGVSPVIVAAAGQGLIFSTCIAKSSSKFQSDRRHCSCFL